MICKGVPGSHPKLAYFDITDLELIFRPGQRFEGYTISNMSEYKVCTIFYDRASWYSNVDLQIRNDKSETYLESSSPLLLYPSKLI